MAITKWTQKVSEGASWMSFEAGMIGKRRARRSSCRIPLRRRGKLVSFQGLKRFANGHADYVANLLL